MTHKPISMRSMAVKIQVKHDDSSRFVQPKDPKQPWHVTTGLSTSLPLSKKNKFASRNLVHIDSNIFLVWGSIFFPALSRHFWRHQLITSNYFRCQWHGEPGKWDETTHLCALYCSIWFQHGKDVQPKIERDIIPPAAARWYEGRGSYSSRPSCGLVLQRGCVAWRRFQLFSVGGRMAASKKGLGWKHVDYPWIITPYIPLSQTSWWLCMVKMWGLHTMFNSC
jgi:hypothetical protein